MRKFCLFLLLCAAAAAAQSAAQPAAKPAAKTAAPAKDAAADSVVIFDSNVAKVPAAFTALTGQELADALETVLRKDYALCTGDESRVSREQLIRWKTRIDSLVMDKGYADKFDRFVAATGIKAHLVRPCEPIVFQERQSGLEREADSAFAAQKAAREKAHNDSMTVIHELKKLKNTPADILDIPAGMSRGAVRTILDRHRIRTVNMPRYLQADQVKFDSLIVTIAFYFDEHDKYNGYEIETEALKAEQLDKTVRKWAELLAAAYEKRLGPPSGIRRVGFHDIKQGNLSILGKWEKDRPKVLIGLATNNYLYYAKVMVNY